MTRMNAITERVVKLSHQAKHIAQREQNEVDKIRKQVLLVRRNSDYSTQQKKVIVTKCMKSINRIQLKYRTYMNPLVTKLVTLSSSNPDILNNPKVIPYNPFKSLVPEKKIAQKKFLEASSFYAERKNSFGNHAMNDANFYANDKIGWAFPNGYHSGCRGTMLDITGLAYSLEDSQKHRTKKNGELEDK